MSSKQCNSSTTIKVVMLPWLAHGHVTPFIELAKKLATKEYFHIYLCSTPVILSSIKNRIGNYSVFSTNNNLTLVELHLPSDDLPSHYHTTTGLPHHLLPALDTLVQASAPTTFSDILKNINPDLVIYDSHHSWAPATVSSNHIPSVRFIITGASLFSLYIHCLRQSPTTFPFPELFPQECFHLRRKKEDEDSSSLFSDGADDVERGLALTRLILVNSFSELEGKYLSYLPRLLGKNTEHVVPVGPLLKDDVDEDTSHIEIMQWLGEKKKQVSSTVLVSFGSEYYLSKKEMEELAHGLELSNVNFIWVVRFPIGEKTSFEEALPEGFLERLCGGGGGGDSKGLVVEKWAPQAKILAHPNIGGFVSHCGWNSTMESLKYGVPVICLPMLSDQPFNARVVEDVGVGFEVKRNKEDGSFGRDDLARAINKVVVEKDGEGIRKKAREMSEIIRSKGDEVIDGLVRDLVQLSKEITSNKN